MSYNVMEEKTSVFPNCQSFEKESLPLRHTGQQLSLISLWAMTVLVKEQLLTEDLDLSDVQTTRRWLQPPWMSSRGHVPGCAGFHVSKPGQFGPSILGKVLYSPSFGAALF